MSSLLDSFRPLFSEAAPRQGDDDARAGHVRRVLVGDGGVRGDVGSGSAHRAEMAHRAEIGFGPESDGLRCSCGPFAATGACSHLWALLRVIAEGEVGGATGSGAQSVAGGRDLGRELEAGWRERLEKLRQRGGHRAVAPSDAARRHEIRYAIDVEESDERAALVFRSFVVHRGEDGAWGEPRKWIPWVRGSQRQMNAADHAIFTLIRGAEETLLRRGGVGSALYDLGGLAGVGEGTFHLGAELAEVIAPKMVRTGRLYLVGGAGGLVGPIGEDTGDPWRFVSRVQRDEKEAVLAGIFARAGERMELDVPLAVLEGGLLVLPDRIARFEGAARSTVLRELRSNGELRVPVEHEGNLAHALLADPTIEPDDVEGLVVRDDVEPTPHLYVESPSSGGLYLDGETPPEGRRRAHGATRLECRVSFMYGGASVDADATERGVVLASRVPVLRDFVREQTYLDRLFELGVQPASEDDSSTHGTVTAGRLRDLVPDLLAEGWSVEAEGRRWRTAVHTSLSVRSGIDWFELEGGANFGSETVALPRLLAAARRGVRTVQLGDGSVGVLPDKWLSQWGVLEMASDVQGDTLRFSTSQGPILDALLAARGDVDVDEQFEAARERWRSFNDPQPRMEPAGFGTELRPYQREGLGWLNALRELGLGGCLADDMGLGKTVQVLALFEELRQAREDSPQDGPRRPSLVVAPRSLVFNWIAEARRFTPGLRVLDYTGPARKPLLAGMAQYDVVLTTYGTLRRDAAVLADVPFDICVLDEAQAIKNASSQVAKAARLVQARQRIALSGTPIENHLGELWSLMEFLQPGLLGRAHAFRRFLKKGGAGSEDELALLGRSIAPFFLRRTKEAVCAELPEKSELVLTCQMSRVARREYDELRGHYRRSILSRADEAGMGGVRMHVLEALLRLRQAACHPGLLDVNRRGEECAKLDVLLPMLDELVEEGHKALVFSQFTSFLSILRERLDQREMPYAYLDGRTRKREEKVRRFQEDDDCQLFLVSLKAGGAGLNLTAADYVFLLDPWWNPATEAQAIDRAHRIGRTQPVIAYRLIAAGTVEERVCELQEKKRQLTGQLLGDGIGGLSSLTREDLEVLFAPETPGNA